MTSTRTVGAASLGLAFLVVVLLRRLLQQKFQFVVVTGNSMTPAFRNGDLVVGRRRISSVSKGDAVIFSVTPSDYEDGRKSVAGRRLKRIVAVAGDPAPDSLPASLRRRHGGRVPHLHVALAGDAPASEGSAEFGYIEVARVESVVLGRLRRGRGQMAPTDERTDSLSAVGV